MIDRKVVGRYGFGVLVVALIFSVQVLPGPRSFDDAYITFRYARNLADGAGFVYNPGQPVMGTSTPLYTLWLAMLSRLTGSSDFSWLALLTNAVCDVIAIVMLRRLLQALTSSAALAAVIALAHLLNPLRIGVALGTMETSVDVMFIVLAFDAYVRQDRSGRAAAFSALAVLVRLDSILLPALLAGHALVVRRRLPWREGFIFALIAGPWLIFATTYFGSVIPNSVAAKTHAYLLPPNSALTSILYFLITRSHIEPMRWPLWLNGVVLAGVLVTYALGVRQSIKVQPRSWPLLIYPVLYVAGLSAGNPFVFMWYYLPLTFAVDSLCLIGIAGLASTGRPMVRLAVLGGVIGASLIVQITAQGPFLDKWPVNFQHREWLYRDAAVQLKTAVRPGMTVAAPEIGVLGYDLPQAVIIDTVGLVTPEAIPLLLKSLLPGQPVYVISSEVIAALRPDYLVTLEAFVRPTLLASPEFEQTYQLIGTIETDELGSRGLLIYRRANLSQMDAQ